MKVKNKLSIYGCGGAGVNAVQQVIDISGVATGFPETNYVAIDTSRSNLKVVEHKPVESYLVPGLDGSGKDRSFAYNSVAEHIDTVLQQHKPTDTSIVIFSLSGGTGSVIGPLLLAELIRRGHNALGICIGSITNGREAANTKATLQTLENLSVNVLQKPIACAFYINGLDSTRKEVDDRIENHVRGIALLVSGENDELDSKDLSNWLNYDKVTKVPAQLVDLVVSLGDEPESDNLSHLKPLGVASLLTSHNDVPIELGQLYGCVGYLPTGVLHASNVEMRPIHFILTSQLKSDRLDSITDAVDTFDFNEEALLMSPSIDHGTDSDGIVF